MQARFMETYSKLPKSRKTLCMLDRSIWRHVPRLIWRAQNEMLTEDLTSFELFLTLSELSKGKALGNDGFPMDFFVAMWVWSLAIFWVYTMRH